MKTSLTIASLVLLAGGLVGCGSDDNDNDGDTGTQGGETSESTGMPSDASTEDFCGNFEQLAADLAKVSPEDDAAAGVKVLQDASASMRETGVPEDASDDIREGLEVTLDAIDALPEDATVDDIGALEDSFTKDDEEKAGAFDDYLDETCDEL